MARSVSNFQVFAQLIATLNNTLDGDAQTAGVVQGFQFRPDPSLTSGTTADKADFVWSDTGRTITSAGSESIDLYDLGSIDIGGGAGKDGLGQAVTLAEIVAIIVVNTSASAGNLIIGGEASAAAWNSPFNGSDTATAGPFPPDSFWYLYSSADPAFAVADTSNHLLKLAASGGDVTYDIAVLGRTA